MVTSPAPDNQPRRAHSRGAALALSVLFVFIGSAFGWYGAIWLAEEVESIAPNGWWLVATIVLLVLFAITSVRYVLLAGMSMLDQWLHARDGDPEEPAHWPTVSIIVPVFNEGPLIVHSLNSLLAQNYPDFEVIVVDDGSHDETYLNAFRMRRLREGTRLRLLTKPNSGKADALNFGIAHAAGELVVCVDGDSKLEPDAIRRLAIHFSEPRMGAVAGCVRVVNRDSLWTRLQSLEYVVGLALMKRAQNAGRAVSIVPGPLGMFRKSALLAVGGYDHDTFAEDFDLTLKLLGDGWHVIYEPAAIAWTEAPDTAMDLLKQRYRWSRGCLQVVFKRRWAWFKFREERMRFLGIWYLVAENLVWPGFNVFGHLLFIATGLLLGLHPFVVAWWLQLVMLDCAISAYSIAAEDEDLRLVWAAPFVRVFYAAFLDTARLLSAIDEFRGTRMTWGKLDRLGKLK